MRLVQCRRVHDDIHAAHALFHEVGVGNRSDVRRERRIKQVEPSHFVPTRLECSDECLAQMPGASRDKNPHRIDWTPRPAGLYSQPIGFNRPPRALSGIDPAPEVCRLAPTTVNSTERPLVRCDALLDDAGARVQL